MNAEKPLPILLLSMTLLAAFAGCQSGNKGGEGPFPAARLPDYPEPTLSQMAPPDNSLRVGEAIEVFVEEDPSLNGTYNVREGGDIILRGAGRIPVEGLGVSAAAATIKAALEQRQLKRASVMVDRVRKAPAPAEAGLPPGDPRVGARKIMVYMTGKVNRPGQHILTLPDDRLLGVYEAILITGGMSRFGDEQKVHVLRPGSDGRKHRIPLNIRSIKQGTAIDPEIGQGDIVVVPEKVFGF